MKLIIIMGLFLCVGKTYSQNQCDSITLTIDSYEDTLKKEGDYIIYLKLKNNGSQPISWKSDEFQVYFKAIYIKRSKDTLTDRGWYENADIDHFAVPYVEILAPGKSKELKFSSFSWLYREGDVKIKLFFRPSYHSTLGTIETGWISQHVKFNYNDYLKQWEKPLN
jgi:hypothetical protein